MSSWLATVLTLPALHRRDDLDERSTVVLLFARFTDEVCSGLLIVLMPTLRARLGLTVQQVGWCYQALFSAGAVVEPIGGAAIDLVARRPLLVWGAAGWAASLLFAAGAPSFVWLLVGFALAGIGSALLAQTADVVLVEAHPRAVERIAHRSTAIDTIGALLAPLAVAVAAGVGLDQRVVLTTTGLAAFGYVGLLASTVLPAPRGRNGGQAWRQVVGNVRDVLVDRRARRLLAALVLVELVDVPDLFEPVWLRDVVGASQQVVAVHAAAGMLASFVALVVADRWLARHDARPLAIACAVATVVLYPAWLLVPGVAAKLLLVVPRYAAMAPLWPILRSQALAALPQRAGTVSAITSLITVLPLAAAFGWVADRVGLTPAMLVVQVGTAIALVTTLRRTDARAPSGAAS